MPKKKIIIAIVTAVCTASVSIAAAIWPELITQERAADILDIIKNILMVFGL